MLVPEVLPEVLPEEVVTPAEEDALPKMLDVIKDDRPTLKAGSAEIVLKDNQVRINQGIAVIAKTTEEGWMEGDPAPADTPPPTQKVSTVRGSQLNFTK